MLAPVSQDPVHVAGGAIRYLLSLRRDDETVNEFFMRLADIEQRRMLAVPPITAEPIVAAKPQRKRAEPTETNRFETYASDHNCRRPPVGTN